MAILPSEPTPARSRWSGDLHRLQRHLLRHPQLLPQGSSLLLAVSGGQDSMALTALLQALQPVHHWQLHLWHGNHGWRQEAAQQALELEQWAQTRQLPFQRQEAPAASERTEASARHWRYSQLHHQADTLGCSRIVTGHTATDRAETVLLNLARGSHRRGLASLRPLRPLTADVSLSRPLLPFSREDTARICREWSLPVWWDPSNIDPRYSRNRVRLEVLPVLEALHPGACRRISAQAERLAADSDQGEELLDLALVASSGDTPLTLQAPPIRRLSAAGQRQLLQHWLGRQTGRSLGSRSLEAVVRGLQQDQPGGLDLPGGWQLRWDLHTLALHPLSGRHG